MDERKKPYLVAIIIQLIFAGMHVISKAAFNFGMSTYVFVFYRQAFPVVFLIPLSAILERGRAPPLSMMTLLKMFVHALVGITLAQNVYNVGLSYASATVGSAVSNSVPVITFILAVLLRIETFELKSLPGTAKVLGLTLCLAGVTIIAFYKGPGLSSLSHHHSGEHRPSYSAEPTHSKTDWIKGSFLMVSGNAAFSLWLVLQGWFLKEYPSRLLFITFQCMFSAIQSWVVAVLFQKDFGQWKLKLNMNLVAVAYAGLVVTGVSFYLQAWCIEKKGPVFMAMWFPLSLIFTVIFSSLFLGEVLHLGSVLGGVLMVGGLYSVLWGKIKENTKAMPCIEATKVQVEEKEMTWNCQV